MKKVKVYAYIIVFLSIILGLGILSYKPGQIIDDSFFCKFEFVNLNGAICNALNQPSMNEVVKLNNGYLMTTMTYRPDEDLQWYADQTEKFHSYLEKRGTKLVFALTPYTASKYDPQMPEGIEDCENENMDRFMKMLEKYDIDSIDFRETMHDDGIDQYDMMYRTDHHWTTEAGLYAYGYLEDYIVEKTGCTVDDRISDISNYDIVRYEKWHLGSRGQRTGIYYGGIDDFDLILPKFETSIQNESGQVGSMQEMMINMEPFDSIDYTSRNTYDSVMRGSLGNFTNLNCPNDIRILIISDSMGEVVNPYLGMGFRQIRHVHNESVSDITQDFIESYDPDVVIMLYYPGCFHGLAFTFSGF